MRNARKRSGLSQDEVAHTLNISQARVSQVESGRVDDIPSLELLTRFLDACGQTLVLSTADSGPQSAEAEPRKAQATTRHAARLEAGALKSVYADEGEAPSGQDYIEE